MPSGDVDSLRLETTAPRARRFFGIRPPSGLEAVAEARLELDAARTGPPNDQDRKDMAARLMAARPGSPQVLTAEEAHGIAADLVAQAQKAVAKLAGGAPDWALTDEDTFGIEAVIQTRGRPAVRVLGKDLEDVSRYPGSEIWKLAIDEYRDSILGVCSATGAVQVRDTLLPRSPWVQGTAWLIAPDLAVTNRHVLFPPNGGTAIARRIPGTTRARMKKDYAVELNFVHDDGPQDGREGVYRVLEVPFVSEQGDPIDAAVLKVERASGAVPIPLQVSSESAFELERLYVVGHPGLMPTIPEPVRLVFGDPDERKRVSFGKIMEPTSEDPAEIVHDASTIGGFSGGCVMGFLAREVRALHYWGDPDLGNRAITASALRRHPDLGPYVTQGGDARQ